VLVIILVLFLAAGRLRHGSPEERRALVFVTLVVANLCLIFTNRSTTRTIIGTLGTPNPALWWVVGGAAGLLVAVLYVPFLKSMFQFGTLHPIDLAMCLAAGVGSILWFEGLKLVTGRRKRASAGG
jgi:Ca2+-transporting ATPase